MKGVTPIRTVSDLIGYLERCHKDAEVLLMPEDGEGFRIGGVLQFIDPKPPNRPEVWVLIDEFAELNSEEWSDECGEGCERPGDMGTIVEAPPVYIVEADDVVQIRGQLKGA